MPTTSAIVRIVSVPLARLIALVLSVATLAFAAAGCGGGGSDSSSGTNPDTWAADVCGALQTWTNDIKSKSQALSSDLGSSSDFKAAKQKVVSFLEDVKQSTQTMVDDVKAAGAPSTKNGKTIQSELESGLTGVRDTFDHAATQAKQLDTSNPRAFVNGVTDLSQQIQTEGQDVAKHFQNVEDTGGELNDAIKNEPSCKGFTSGSS